MKYFGGDFYTACEYYFRNVSYVVSKTGADIIGHFDLISKFNEKDQMFDEHNPRYIEAWKKAAASLLLTGRPFEINTGAISRGWRSEAYPSPDIIRYIKERGGELILSSDSHNAENIGYGFRDAAKLIS